MLADFIVLDRDITNAHPAKLLETKVLRTIVAGKTVLRSQIASLQAAVGPHSRAETPPPAPAFGRFTTAHRNVVNHNLASRCPP